MTASALRPGSRVGKYQILQVIGAGGFGITYKAKQINASKYVAIKEFFPSEIAKRRGSKVIIEKSAVQSEFVQLVISFVNEGIKLRDHVKHKNIVSVTDIVTKNNTSYIIMDFIEGESLEKFLQKAGIETLGLKSFITELLDAIEYIHSLNEMHRDISPNNIMVTEVEPGRYKPILIDFGAAASGINIVRSNSSLIVASLSYAPPEQLATEGARIHGKYTDIFSIGATLYRALNQKRPVDAISRLMLTSSGKPDPLPDLSVGEGVDEFLLKCARAAKKCMALEPFDRPQSIGELRRLLGLDAETNAYTKTTQLTIETESTTDANTVLYRPAFPETPAKQPNNKKYVPIALVLLSIASIFMTAWALVRRAPPPEALVISKPSQMNASHIQPLNQMALGQKSFAPAAPAKLSQLDANAPSVLTFVSDGTLAIAAGAGSVITRRSEERMSPPSVVHRHAHPIATVFVNKTSRLISADTKGTIIISNIDGEMINIFNDQKRSIKLVALSDDDRTFVTVYSDNNLAVWDARRGVALWFWKSKSSINAISYSPSLPLVAIGSDDGVLTVINIDTRQVVWRLAISNSPIACLAFSPDGQTIAAGLGDGAIVLQSLFERDSGEKIEGLRIPIRAITFSTDGRYISTAASSQSVTIREAKAPFRILTTRVPMVRIALVNDE